MEVIVHLLHCDEAHDGDQQPVLPGNNYAARINDSVEIDQGADQSLVAHACPVCKVVDKLLNACLHNVKSCLRKLCRVRGQRKLRVRHHEEGYHLWAAVLWLVRVDRSEILLVLLDNARKDDCDCVDCFVWMGRRRRVEGEHVVVLMVWDVEVERRNSHGCLTIPCWSKFYLLSWQISLKFIKFRWDLLRFHVL
eukprot:XP_001708628.1 Hypothetical protein GL50803_32309 [Giardia lamblia ATCC 50803]